MYTKDTVDFMYRKDWADKLGLTLPTNVDELYDFMLAMVQQDPDGNGVDDTYGFVFKKGWTSASPLICAFLPETFTQSLGFHYDADGNIQNIFDDRDSWIKMLTWFQNAYSDGIFSEDFMQDTKSSAETKFVSGHSGLWPKNGIYIGSRLQTLRENFPEGEIVALPAIECYMSEYGTNLNIQGGRSSSLYDPVIHLTTFCEDLERGKMFLEINDSWAGQTAWYLGAEGESYDIVDGQYVFKEDEYLSRINLGDLMANPWGNPLPFYRDVDKEVEAAVQYIVANADNVDSPAPIVQRSEAYLTYAADIQAAIDQFLVEVCIGEKNPEDFDAFIQNLYDNFNLQMVIDEVTGAAAE
jgi:putative aldouronate transport system substrate-binding protein